MSSSSISNSPTPSTQFAIYNRLQGEKEMKILPEYAHDAMHVSEAGQKAQRHFSEFVSTSQRSG